VLVWEDIPLCGEAPQLLLSSFFKAMKIIHETFVLKTE
jgi:hypothetical protein